MLVYRVENEVGDGPYIHYHKLLINFSEFHGVNTPTPKEDGIPNCVLYRFPHFAFSELDQLINWFNIESIALKDFYIGVYEVSEDECYRGRNQLVFNKKLSRLIIKVQLTSPIQELKSLIGVITTGK